MAKISSNRPALIRLGAALAITSLALAGCSSTGAPAPAAAGETEGAAPVAGPPVEVAEADWDALVEAATAEGEVTLYSSLAGGEPVWEAFQEAYPGITVTVERAPSSDLITKVGQEQQANAGRADVMLHELLPWFDEQSEAGHLASLQLSPQAQEDDWQELLGDDHYPTLIALPFSIAWNTDSAEPVESIEEIIEEHPDARIGLFDANVTPGISYQFKAWEDAHGDDLMERLAELDTTVFGSATPMSQSLAAGEIDYALPMTPVLSQLIADGAPIDSVLPEEALVALPRAAAVMGTAPHPNAAQLFVNWLMSEEGQRALVEKFSPGSPHLAIDGELLWEDVELFDADAWTNDDAAEWIPVEWEGRY